MSQVSAKLRRGVERYFHWCPGCEEMHPLPDRWSFNGNLDAPTFNPSFLHHWGSPAKRQVCHYVLTDGVLNFCADCTHALAGKRIPLPDLPADLQDPPSTFAPMTDDSSPKAPEATQTPDAQPPAEAAPAATPAPAAATGEKPDDAPIVIDETEEVEAPKAVRVGGHPSIAQVDAAPAEPSPPEVAPPAVEAADAADPWGMARHESHKAEIANALPDRPELPADRELSFDEFRAFAEPLIEAMLRREYNDYLEDLRAHAKPAV